MCGIKQDGGIIHEICTTDLIIGNCYSYKLYELLGRHFSTSKVACWSCHYLYYYHAQTKYVKLNREYSCVHIFWRYVPQAFLGQR